MVELTDAKADIANRPAAETLFKFSQNFGLGNLFELVVQSRRKAAGQSNTRFVGAFLDVMARALRLIAQ